MQNPEYYKKIADYYDREAGTYEKRQSPNKTLRKIRNDFRIIAETYLTGSEVLDLGCGTGSDLCYFAEKYPGKNFLGLDISPNMTAETAKAITRLKLNNAFSATGTLDILADKRFDFIYVFFGALNTVHDLNQIVRSLSDHLNENGRVLVTFVNKWYPLGIIAYLRRLKFVKAFERLQKTWPGYSETYSLESKMYYARQILNFFKPFRLLYKRGYSIIYPAWYQDRITNRLGSFAEKIWRLDGILSKTPFWSWGEYVLFVFEKRRR